MTTAKSKTDALSDEYREAAEKMSQRELDLSGAFLDVNDGLAAAVELLGLLTDESAADYDPSHALVAGEASRILRDAFAKAYAAHAAFIARINGPELH